MAYNFPTVGEFKAQFARDFPYAVPAWGAAAGDITLAAGAITAVALSAGGQGYKVAPTVTVKAQAGAGATITATVAAGKVTGFVVGAGGAGYVAPTIEVTGGAGDETNLTEVQDADITGAIIDAKYNCSQALFDSQEAFSRAFLYLAAHCLVEKLLAAGEGMASQFNWLTAAKGVGDVSESFMIPDRITRDPMLATFSKTRYGALYLQIISPLLIGNIQTSYRQSLP